MPINGICIRELFSPLYGFPGPCRQLLEPCKYVSLAFHLQNVGHGAVMYDCGFEHASETLKKVSLDTTTNRCARNYGTAFAG